MDNKALPISSLGLAQFKHQEWAVTLPPGDAVPYERLLEPDAWKHVAIKFKPGDMIHVRSPDNTLYARLMVRSVGKMFLTVEEIEKKVFGASVETDIGKLDVRFAGRAKWAVYRKSDNERIKDGFDTKEEAAAWAEGHIKEMAA
jgi:hypothetical protein